jgi:hypothetical protein
VIWTLFGAWWGTSLALVGWLWFVNRVRRRKVAQVWDEIRNTKHVYCVGLWDIHGVVEVRGRSVPEVLARASAIVGRRMQERAAHQGEP